MRRLLSVTITESFSDEPRCVELLDVVIPLVDVKRVVAPPEHGLLSLLLRVSHNQH
jgi:hypothetical protein